MARINWEELKKEFILGDYKSLRVFADKKGLKYNGNFMKKTKGWSDEKVAKGLQKSCKIVERTIEKQINHEVDRNTRHLNMWDTLLDIVDEVMNGKDQHLQTKAGNINVYAIEKLTSIVERAQKGQRLAEGLDMDKQQAVDVSPYVEALNGIADEVWNDEE
jgi:hypothetical protein